MGGLDACLRSGLEEPLKALMPDVLDHGLDCKASRYAMQGKPQESPPSDPARRRAIARTMARELVRNFIKHAQARSGAITLTTDATGLVLSVEDDGVGFTEGLPGAADPGQGGRFGLYRVRERVALLGDRLDIAPLLAPGSRVSIRLPPVGVPA